MSELAAQWRKHEVAVCRTYPPGSAAQQKGSDGQKAREEEQEGVGGEGKPPLEQVKGKNTSNYNPQRPTLNRARVRERTKAHRRRLKKAAAAALLLLGVCVGHSVARSVARSLARGPSIWRHIPPPFLFPRQWSTQRSRKRRKRGFSRYDALCSCVHACVPPPPDHPAINFVRGSTTTIVVRIFVPRNISNFTVPFFHLPPLFSALSIRNLAPTTEWGFPRVKFAAQLVL